MKKGVHGLPFFISNHIYLSLLVRNLEESEVSIFQMQKINLKKATAHPSSSLY